MKAGKRRRNEIENFTFCRLVQQKTSGNGKLDAHTKLLQNYMHEKPSQKSIIRTCHVQAADSKAIEGKTLLERLKHLEKIQKGKILCVF